VQKLEDLRVKATLETVQLDGTADKQIDEAAEWIERNFGRWNGGYLSEADRCYREDFADEGACSPYQQRRHLPELVGLLQC